MYHSAIVLYFICNIAMHKHLKCGINRKNESQSNGHRAKGRKIPPFDGESKLRNQTEENVLWLIVCVHSENAHAAGQIPNFTRTYNYNIVIVISYDNDNTIMIQFYYEVYVRTRCPFRLVSVNAFSYSSGTQK